MALRDNKIAAWSSPVVNQPDRPQIGADELKSVFDSNTNELKAAFNNMIDDLERSGGIDLIGSTPIDGIKGDTVTQQINAVLKASNDEIKAVEETLSNKIDDVESRTIPAGGTEGQYMVKKSAADYDVKWSNPPSGPGGQGPQGEQGPPGYTPIRGVDYWTEADKAEIRSYVDEAILGGAW